MNKQHKDLKIDKMNKVGEYKSPYLKELNPNPFVFDLVPGINAPQLQQNISIQT